MTAPLVTIGMPAYNHGRFIGHAIESVLAQTFTDWELIVVDDASTDDTLAVALKFTDPRIRVIAQAANSGPGATGNVYAREARGHWISPLPSDDAYAPTRLEEQLRYLDAHPDCDMVITGLRYIDEQGSLLDARQHFATDLLEFRERSREEWLRYFFDRGNPLAASAMMFRRSLVERCGFLDPRLLQLQDFDWWIRFVLAGCRIGFIPAPLTDYRAVSGGNLSARSLAVYHRCVYERSHIYRRFYGIRTPGELRAVFPDMPAYDGGDDREREIWIRHRLAERAWTQGDPAHRHFALETWYELFGDEANVALLETWGMPIRRFYELTAQSPLSRHAWRSLQYRLYQALSRFLSLRERRWLKERARLLLRRK